MSELWAVDRSPDGITRRRFLQGALALSAIGAIDLRGLLMDLAEAAPLGSSDQVVVFVVLAGGNDFLNTVAPVDAGAYRSARGALALDQSTALRIGGGLALHPSLAHLKARYDTGKVAIVQGIGEAHEDHSHFSSMATWMSGQVGGQQATGWLGRHLDGLGLPGLTGVSIGDIGMPLLLRGAHAPVTGIPSSAGLFGGSPDGSYDQLTYNALAALGGDTSGKGAWATTMGAAFRDCIGVATMVKPAFASGLPNASLARDLTLAARIINLDVGARVLTAQLGNFDTHDNQLAEHADQLSSLDAGIEAFFTTLSPTFRDRVTMVVFTEFGRRVLANDSGGTDHGAAGGAFVIGDPVRGGLHGAYPSLTALTSRGDLQWNVDFRSLFGTVLTDLLGGDDTAIFGSSFPRLALFKAAPTSSPPPPTSTGSLSPVSPARLLDTRTTGTPLDAPTPRAVPVAGRGGVPASGAGAVVLNLTVTEPDQPSFLSAWASGSPRPSTSNVNYLAGQTRANLAIVEVGPDGNVLLADGFGHTHVVVDVFGWFPSTGACLTSVAPTRLLDTRDAGPAGRVGAGGTVDVVAVGRGEVPASGVGAVVVNLTAVEPSTDTYLTAYPTGVGRPLASNLNPVAGQVVANLAIVPVGAGGKVTVFNASGDTDLVVDVFAWLPASDSRYGALSPVRVLDTREAGDPVGAGDTRRLDLSRAGVPSRARSVAMNLTAVDATAGTYVTAYPTGGAVPPTSNVNVQPGQVVPNLAVVPIGSDGTVTLRNAYGSVHVVADVCAWFA